MILNYFSTFLFVALFVFRMSQTNKHSTQHGKHISLNEARVRQAEILSQAKTTGDSMIREAREKAQAEGAKMLLDAKAQIAAEKENALRDIKQTVADLSVVIAEKVVRQKLADNEQQQKLIERMLDEVCK